MKLPLKLFILALALAIAAHSQAQTASGKGGTLTDNTNIIVSGVTMSTGGTASLSCVETGFTAGPYGWKWTCEGGTLAIPTASGLLTGAFTSGSMTYSGSGGGRGGKVTYWYVLNATFAGTLNGEPVSGTLLVEADTTVNGSPGSVVIFKASY
jgi:hypothetical protein